MNGLEVLFAAPTMLWNARLNERIFSQVVASAPQR